jgi:hypothetical protein
MSWVLTDNPTIQEIKPGVLFNGSARSGPVTATKRGNVIAGRLACELFLMPAPQVLKVDAQGSPGSFHRRKLRQSAASQLAPKAA